MAKIFVSDCAFDMRELNLRTIVKADYLYGFSRIHVRLTEEGIYHKLRGEDFVRNSADDLISGKIHTYEVANASRMFVVKELSIDVEKLAHVAATKSLKDDHALVRWQFHGEDFIVGDNGNSDRLYGYGGNDVIKGRYGADWLSGGAGDDIIDGGFDRDILRGGTGADIFLFRANDSSFYQDGMFHKNGCDKLIDFSSKEHDKIDLSRIDARIDKPGNQALIFDPDNLELRAAGKIFIGYFGKNSYIGLDNDTPDGSISDVMIFFDDAFNLKESDFIL